MVFIEKKRTYVVILCGSSISMSISSLVASVTELVWDVKRLPLPIGNTLLTLPNSRTSSFDVQNRSRENALQPTDVSCHLNLANQLLFPREISRRFSAYSTAHYSYCTLHTSLCQRKILFTSQYILYIQPIDYC